MSQTITGQIRIAAFTVKGFKDIVSSIAKQTGFTDVISKLDEVHRVVEIKDNSLQYYTVQVNGASDSDLDSQSFIEMLSTVSDFMGVMFVTVDDAYGNYKFMFSESTSESMKKRLSQSFLYDVMENMVNSLSETSPHEKIDILNQALKQYCQTNTRNPSDIRVVVINM